MSPGGRISENEQQRHKSQGEVIRTFTAAILWIEQDRSLPDGGGGINDKFMGEVSKEMKLEDKEEEGMEERDKSKK